MQFPYMCILCEKNNNNIIYKNTVNHMNLQLIFILNLKFSIVQTLLSNLVSLTLELLLSN